MSSSSRRVARQHVQAPDRLRRRAGQRHVDAVARAGRARARRAASSLGARRDQRLERLARLVGRLADGAALRGLELGDAAQHLRQLGLAPEVAHAQLLELPRCRGGRRRSPPRPRARSCCDPLDHDAGTLSMSRPSAGHLVQRHRRRHRGVQRLAPRSGSARTRRTRASTSSGSPSRSAPTSSVQRRAAARSGPRSGSPAPAHERDRARPAARASAVDARERDGEDRAHARAHRLRAVGVGAAGPERDARGAEGLRGAQHRADVAGVADAVQVHAQRPRGRAPALLVDADHARARAERGDARERRRARRRGSPRAPSPVPAQRGSPRRGARPGAPRPPRSRSSPSATKRPLRARSRLPCSRRRAFRRGSAGRRCGHVGCAGGSLGAGTKKGAVPFRSDAREAVCRCRRAG